VLGSKCKLRFIVYAEQPLCQRCCSVITANLEALGKLMSNAFIQIDGGYWHQARASSFS